MIASCCDHPTPAEAAILRVPILFGEVERVDESAVTVLWDKVQEGVESCTLDHCQQRYPTYVNDVARVCRNMAERRMQVCVCVCGDVCWVRSIGE